MKWYRVQQQPWRRWPKVLVVEQESDDGLEYMRYVPETEVTRLREENDKLWQAFGDTFARFTAANETTEVNYMDEDYCDLLRELGMEVGEWATQTARS